MQPPVPTAPPSDATPRKSVADAEKGAMGPAGKASKYDTTLAEKPPAPSAAAAVSSARAERIVSAAARIAARSIPIAVDAEPAARSPDASGQDRDGAERCSARHREARRCQGRVLGAARRVLRRQGRERAREPAEEAGYPAYTEPLKTSRGTLWRVRVGPYASRDAAGSVRDKLKAEGQNGIVAAGELSAAPMTAFDLVVIVVVALSTLFAFVRGVVRELIALIAWVVGFVGGDRVHAGRRRHGFPTSPAIRCVRYVIAFALILIVALARRRADRLAARQGDARGGPGLCRSLSRLHIRSGARIAAGAGVRARRGPYGAAARRLVAEFRACAAARRGGAGAAALAAAAMGGAARLFA